MSLEYLNEIKSLRYESKLRRLFHWKSELNSKRSLGQNTRSSLRNARQLVIIGTYIRFKGML